MNFLALFLIVTTSLIVYFDARKIGVRSNLLPGFLSGGPIEWFFATLFIWPIAFPMYAINRKKYLAALDKKSKDGFTLFAALVGIVCVGLIILPFFSSRSALPACSEVVAVATASTKSLLEYHNQSHDSISIENVHENGFDPSGNRLCKATLKADSLVRDMQFDIQWEDPAEGTFSVGIAVDGFPNP